MTRDKLLARIGFQDDFIEHLNKYEEENPSIIKLGNNFSYESVSFSDTQESIISASHSDYLNNYFIK